MKYKLPILTAGAVLLLAGAQLWDSLPFAAIWPLATAQTTRSKSIEAADGRVEKKSTPSASRQVLGGGELLQRSAKVLASHRGLRAKLRHRVQLFGQQLAGTGEYLHSDDRSGRPPRFRWELKLPVSGQLTATQQVCDGRFLWFHRTYSNNVTFSRVDLRRLEQTLGPRATQGHHSLLQVGAGGVPGLLRNLANHFDFGAPQQDQLRRLPVWRLKGQWKKDRLAQWLPDQAEAIRKGGQVNLSKLPSHLPHQVMIVLGRDDKITLFPYLLEYQQQDKKAGKGTPVIQAIVTVEFFQVALVPPLPDSEFTLDPGDQLVQDDTDDWISRASR